MWKVPVTYGDLRACERGCLPLPFNVHIAISFIPERFNSEKAHPPQYRVRTPQYYTNTPSYLKSIFKMAGRECYLVCLRYSPPRFYLVATHEGTKQSKTHEVTQLEGPSNAKAFFETFQQRGYSFELLTSSGQRYGPGSNEWKSVFDISSRPSILSRVELNAFERWICRIGKLPTVACNPNDIDSISLAMMRAYITTAECRALFYPAYRGGLNPPVYSQNVIREAMIVKELETGSSRKLARTCRLQHLFCLNPRSNGKYTPPRSLSYLLN